MRHITYLLGLVFFILPVFVSATTVVNINTASVALLDTLPGIGPSKAQDIIDYRNAHGLFAAIADIQNVSGIGPSTYAGLKAFITVSDASVSSAPDAASSTPSATTSSGGSSVYVPPPATIAIAILGDEYAELEVPIRLLAQVTTKNGAIDSTAQVTWSFGDGSSATGIEIEKTYHYAGTYLVVVSATDGSTKARDEISIVVSPAKVRIAAISGEGIDIANDSSKRLDLSGWRLISDTGSFRIPVGMAVLPNTTVFFPFIITNLPVALDATLVYPDGIIAARYVPVQAVVPPASLIGSSASSSQLSAGSMSYKEGKEVEPITSTTANAQSYVDAVLAPAAATELAAAGAAVPTPKLGSPGIFSSPWTLSFVGVLALAGSAFIFL